MAKWYGRAGKSFRPRVYATAKLIRMLDKFKLLPPDFDDDWGEVFREYVERMLRKGL